MYVRTMSSSTRHDVGICNYFRINRFVAKVRTKLREILLPAIVEEKEEVVGGRRLGILSILLKQPKPVSYMYNIVLM